MTLIVAIAVVAVLVWFVLGAVRKRQVNTAERQLARMLDRAAAERLIRWEMMREPKLTRAEAAERALERAERDRGR